MTDTTQHDLKEKELAPLMPCPFCGGAVKLEEAHIQHTAQFGERKFWGVVCRNTTNLGGTCCMEQVPSASKEAAIGRWNQRPQVVAQQARIASLKDVIEKASYAIEAEQFHVTEKILALATTDDLSALKAHDDALWNEALTTGIEWQATRGHTLDADDYGNELRSLKR